MLGALAWFLVGALAGVVFTCYLVDATLHDTCRSCGRPRVTYEPRCLRCEPWPTSIPRS